MSDASAQPTQDGGPLPDAVVFDLDGTLVDTESISEQVLTEVLGGLGHEVTHDDLVQVRGRAFAWLQDWLWQRFEVDAEQYRALAGPAWARGMEHGIPTFADATGLLDDLTEAGVPMAVCTSSGRGHLDRVLEVLAWQTRFRATVSATDVARHKPDPMPYRLAIELLGTEAARSVAIEDTVVGATAAVAAGLRVIGRPHPEMADLSGIAHLQVDHLDLAALHAVLPATGAH